MPQVHIAVVKRARIVGTTMMQLRRHRVDELAVLDSQVSADSAHGIQSDFVTTRVLPQDVVHSRHIIFLR